MLLSWGHVELILGPHSWSQLLAAEQHYYGFSENREECIPVLVLVALQPPCHVSCG